MNTVEVVIRHETVPKSVLLLWKMANMVNEASEMCKKIPRILNFNHYIILGMLFSSGLGATTSLIHLLDNGDHVVAMNDLYGGKLL